MEKKELVRDLHPWEGAKKGGRFPHSGNPCHCLGDQSGQIGNLKYSGERAAADSLQVEHRENRKDSPNHLAVLSSWKHALVVCMGPRCWNRGFHRGLGLAVQRQPKGARAWSGPQPGICTEWSQVLHSSLIVNTQAKRGGKPHHRHLLLHVFTWLRACLQELWEHTSTSRLLVGEVGAEIWASSLWLCDLSRFAPLVAL